MPRGRCFPSPLNRRPRFDSRRRGRCAAGCPEVSLGADHVQATPRETRCRVVMSQCRGRLAKPVGLGGRGPGRREGAFPSFLLPRRTAGSAEPEAAPTSARPRGSNTGHTGRCYFQERAEFPSNPCAEDAAAPGSVTRGPQEPLGAAGSTRLGGAQRGARAGGEMGAPEVSNHSVALTGPGGRCAARRPAFRAGEGQTERIRTGEGVSDRRCPSLPLLSHSSPASSSQPAALGLAGGRKTTENKHKPNSLSRPAVSR